MMKAVFLAALTFLGAVTLNYLDKTLYPLVLREELRVVPDQKVVELVSLDHRGLAADLLFIQVNLHSGSLMWKPLKFQFDSEWSYGMMDLITNLDPKYYVAYLFAGMGLIHRFDDAKRARPILEKGIAMFPESWELPFWIGYDHYVYLEEYETAGEYFWEAAHRPGAPRSLLALMLSALKKGGDYERAAWAMEALLEGTQKEKLKVIYLKKLIQLQNLAALQRAASRYREERGRFPTELSDLVAAGFLEELPEDPWGMSYEWNAEKGRVVMKRQRPPEPSG